MEKIDNVLELINAFKEDKIIEVKHSGVVNGWERVNTLDYLLTLLSKTGTAHVNDTFRIAKEPAYRPYANVEEFLKASKEHNGWLKNSGGASNSLVIGAYYNASEELCIETYHRQQLASVFLKEGYRWADDNSPCGILEE